MSKELEALKGIRNAEIEIGNDHNTAIKVFEIGNDYDEHFIIIAKGLKELEERREMMRRFNEACVPMTLDNKTEKKLKALEIIKEKEVNIHSWYYNNCNKIPHEIYKQSIMAKTISSKLLTQEEYDLLKEVLE